MVLRLTWPMDFESLYCFPGSGYNFSCLVGGVTNVSLGNEPKSLKDGMPTSFEKMFNQTNKYVDYYNIHRQAVCPYCTIRLNKGRSSIYIPSKKVWSR